MLSGAELRRCQARGENEIISEQRHPRGDMRELALRLEQQTVIDDLER
jgi:hypothetical protein